MTAGADSRPTTLRVAFIGLGVMGGPMLRNLTRSGHACAAYDLSPQACSAVADCARVAASPAEAARDADVLFTMLPTSAHTRAALFGDDGAAAALRPGSLVVEMSTGDAIETDRIGADLRARGLRCIDAPVGRTPREAAQGKALFMVGASTEDIDAARPLLEFMGDTIVHVGPFGNGIRLKLVNNYVSMVTMVLTGEALMFASRLGIDRDTAVRVMSNTTAGRGQLLTNFPKKVLAGDVSADFPLRMGLKDISLAMSLANAVGAPLGLGGYAREMFSLAKAWGRQDEDCTAMLLLLEDMAHVPHTSPSPQAKAKASDAGMPPGAAR